MSLTRNNNFDLLRLFAAYQVVFFHASIHLEYQSTSTAYTILTDIYYFFPGVPVFFIISGFLISSSLERNRENLKYYFVSRFLRIYPGLWGAFLFSWVAIFVSGYWRNIEFLSSAFFVWLFTQLTFFQNWTPQFLKDLGFVGGFNGALWTIPIELAFYVILPILYIFVIEKFERRWVQNICLILIGFLSFWAQVSYNQLMSLLNFISPFSQKFLWYTFVPHLWIFILGLLAWRNFDRIRPLVEGRFLLWTSIYIGVNYGLECLYKAMNHSPEMLYNYQEMTQPAHWLYNGAYALTRVLLVMWVLAAAFSKPALAGKILRGQDISYGTYLYHVLLINVMVAYGFTGTGLSFLTAFLGSGLLGLISWIAVEKKFLKLKKKSVEVPESPGLVN